MSSPDQYCVPTGSATAEFRDRGSKFVAVLYPSEVDDDFKIEGLHITVVDPEKQQT